MKRFLIVIASSALIVYAFSCKKTTNESSCTGTRAAVDSTALLAFAKANGITPVMDTSFMYYQIIKPGTGASPNPSSVVYVRYHATFLDGSYLDSSGASTVGFGMSVLIKGWQYGLPKIAVGGQIKLLVPSALAYGCYGNQSVPSNTPLYFNIYLDSLK